MTKFVEIEHVGVYCDEPLERHLLNVDSIDTITQMGGKAGAKVFMGIPFVSQSLVEIHTRGGVLFRMIGTREEWVKRLQV